VILNEAEPTPPSQGRRFHVVSRYAEAVAVLEDWATYSSSLNPSTIEADRLLSELDRPQHMRIRQAMSGVLGRRALTGIASAMETESRRVALELPAPGRVDLIADIAIPAVHHAIATLVGIPFRDRAAVFAWAANITADPFGIDATAPNGTALDRLDAYLHNLVREADQADDNESSTAIAGLLAAGAHTSPPMSDREIVVQVRSLVMSGFGASVDFLGVLLHRLVITPGLWEQVRQDRSLLESVATETLRFDAPAPLLNRRCTRTTTVGGQTINADDILVIAIGLANHDETIHPDPDHFAPGRPQSGQHLSFGAGPHICPGISLVRLLLATVMQPLLDRFSQAPQLIPEFHYERSELFVGRGPRRLDVDIPDLTP